MLVKLVQVFDRYFYPIVVAVLLCVATPLMATTRLDASVDRNRVAKGETLQLNITLQDKDWDNAPNFEPLEKDFSILGVAHQQRVNIINGQSTRSTEWRVTLSPKRTGTVTIPSFVVSGLTSTPLSIDVSAQVQPTDQQESRDVFFTTHINPTTPFVQSQAIYTVLFHYNKNIENAEFTEPHGDNITLFHLGKDKHYQKVINNKTYQVLERRYAVIPQKSGPLTLEGGYLQGKVWRGEPGSPIQIPHMEPIRIMAERTSLNVQPMPGAADKAWWLPAEKLTVKEDWSAKPLVWRMGEPVTRTITIEAVGLTAEQLPKITLPTMTHVQIYPDKPVLETTTDGKTLLARRVEKFAILPTKGGVIDLPPINVHWWDINARKQNVATIGAYRGKVMADGVAAGAENSVVNPAVNAAPLVEPQGAGEKAKAVTQGSNRIWPLLATLFALAWLVTIFLWWRGKALAKTAAKSVFAKKTLTITQVRDQLKKACAQNEMQQAKVALIDWANILWPKVNFRSLGDIEKYVNDITCKAALAKLDKLLYAGKNADWNGKAFWNIIVKEFVRKDKNDAGKDQDLPDLYLG